MSGMRIPWTVVVTHGLVLTLLCSAYTSSARVELMALSSTLPSMLCRMTTHTSRPDSLARVDILDRR